MLTMQEDAMVKAFQKTIPFSEVNTLSSLLLAGDPEKEEKTAPKKGAEGSEEAV